MKTICFFNLKGGVGKTMTTANVAYDLATLHGKYVLCIDADSQGNLSQYFGVTESGSTTAELMTELFDYYPDFVTPTKEARIDIIPANADLMDFDVSAIKSGRANLQAINDLRLAIEDDNQDALVYDYILIDCPPAFTAAASAALVAADEVIIPIRLDAFSTAGMAELTAQIRNMKALNPRLTLRGLLVTQMVNSPEALSALEWLRTKSGLPVFDGVIRHSPRVCGSTFAREPLEVFSRNCAAAVDYRRFVADLIGGDDDGL